MVQAVFAALPSPMPRERLRPGNWWVFLPRIRPGRGVPVQQIQTNPIHTMKFQILFLAIAGLALPACEKKSDVGNSINDAMDRRPNEKLRDAGEDIKDAVQDVTR